MNETYSGTYRRLHDINMDFMCNGKSYDGIDTEAYVSELKSYRRMYYHPTTSSSSSYGTLVYNPTGRGWMSSSYRLIYFSNPETLSTTYYDYFTSMAKPCYDASIEAGTGIDSCRLDIPVDDTKVCQNERVKVYFTINDNYTYPVKLSGDINVTLNSGTSYEFTAGAQNYHIKVSATKKILYRRARFIIKKQNQ